MKVKQVITVDNISNVYLGWQGLEFTDASGNECNVHISDEMYLDLEPRIIRKANSIREERAAKARELMEESSSDE